LRDVCIVGLRSHVSLGDLPQWSVGSDHVTLAPWVSIYYIVHFRWAIPHGEYAF
jgi:hypothetical protein